MLVRNTHNSAHHHNIYDTAVGTTSRIIYDHRSSRLPETAFDYDNISFRFEGFV